MENEDNWKEDAMQTMKMIKQSGDGKAAATELRRAPPSSVEFLLAPPSFAEIHQDPSSSTKFR